MATDNYQDAETPVEGTYKVKAKASGAIARNDVVMLVTAAVTGVLYPTVKKSDTNDSDAVFGVACDAIADGDIGDIQKAPGVAKVKITCTTVAIAVGDPLASDNGGGVKEAANAGNAQQILGYARHASTTLNDEILMDLAK